MFDPGSWPKKGLYYLGAPGIPAGEFHGCPARVRNNMRQTLHEFAFPPVARILRVHG